MRLLGWGAGLLALTAMLVGLFAAIHPARSAPPRGPAPVIIVLAGGADAEGVLDEASLRRLETGVALFDAGLAPRLHLSGGGEAGDTTTARIMRREALRRGVPDAAISVEERSNSTLQNALFSADVLGGLPPGAVLVTDAYHLPRAWASFRWAGAERPALAASRYAVPLHRRAGDLARESLAWWFNLARVGVWHAAGLAGLPDARRNALLR